PTTPHHLRSPHDHGLLLAPAPGRRVPPRRRLHVRPHPPRRLVSGGSPRRPRPNSRPAQLPAPGPSASGRYPAPRPFRPPRPPRPARPRRPPQDRQGARPRQHARKKAPRHLPPENPPHHRSPPGGGAGAETDRPRRPPPPPLRPRGRPAPPLPRRREPRLD